MVNPSTELVIKFQRIQGSPQPGVARLISEGGSIAKKPHSGPRMNQRRGHAVAAIQKPIDMRATYQHQTASEPWM